MDNEKNWYPKYPSIHVSKENWYPCIQVSMYPSIHDIQVSTYPSIQKNQYPRYPSIRISEKSGIHSSLRTRQTIYRITRFIKTSRSATRYTLSLKRKIIVKSFKIYTKNVSLEVLPATPWAWKRQQKIVTKDNNALMEDQEETIKGLKKQIHTSVYQIIRQMLAP